MKILSLLAAVVMAVALPCFGQSGTLAGYTAITTNGSTTLSSAIISARGFNAGAPCVTFISATSDQTASSIKAYPVITASTLANYNNSTVTLPVIGTNGFAANDFVIIRHISNDTYEKRLLTTSTGSTNLVVTVAPLQTVTTNDVIYRVSTNAANTVTIPVGVTTLNLSGSGLVIGQGGRPLLIEVSGGTNATLNAATAIYLNPKL